MRYLLSFALVLLLASPVFAAKTATEETSAGGFEGPVRVTKADTVESALKLAPDSRVVLTGNVVASVDGERNHYIFQDKTGEMTVVITPKQFRDNIIRPETVVRLSGRIEKSTSSPDTLRLRVNQLEIIK